MFRWRPRAHEAIGDDAEMIMMLKNVQHTLPYWDKTDPKTIKEIFELVSNVPLVKRRTKIKTRA